MLLQTFPADGIDYGDIAYLNGKIYATDLFSGSIDIFDSSTLTYESTISSVGGLSGLAGDPDRGVLWGVAQGLLTARLRDRSRHRRRDHLGTGQRPGGVGRTSRTRMGC